MKILTDQNTRKFHYIRNVFLCEQNKKKCKTPVQKKKTRNIFGAFLSFSSYFIIVLYQSCKHIKINHTTVILFLKYGWNFTFLSHFTYYWCARVKGLNNCSVDLYNGDLQTTTATFTRNLAKCFLLVIVCFVLPFLVQPNQSNVHS